MADWEELKPCPKCKGLCHVEIIETAVKPPKNIRIGCEMHSYWLPDLFESASDAIKEWNRRANNG
jgi:hypothetical protein